MTADTLVNAEYWVSVLFFSEAHPKIMQSFSGVESWLGRLNLIKAAVGGLFDRSSTHTRINIEGSIRVVILIDGLIHISVWKEVREFFVGQTFLLIFRAVQLLL